MRTLRARCGVLRHCTCASRRARRQRLPQHGRPVYGMAVSRLAGGVQLCRLPFQECKCCKPGTPGFAAVTTVVHAAYGGVRRRPLGGSGLPYRLLSSVNGCQRGLLCSPAAKLLLQLRARQRALYAPQGAAMDCTTLLMGASSGCQEVGEATQHV